MAQTEYIVLVIEAMKSSLVDAVAKLAASHPELGHPHIVLVTTTPDKYRHFEAQHVRVLECNFTAQQIAHALGQIREPIAAVICRGDMYVQYLRQMVPLLPAGVKLSSAVALKTATNKRLMRQAFTAHYPEITPGYVKVSNADTAAVKMVLSSLQFPVIVKPASLASSLMIQKCVDAAQLQASLERVFSQLADTYKQEGRGEKPEVIVEEFMEGDFYSLDSYVREPKDIRHTPLVAYIPANTLGIDDFFLYKRFAPVNLSAKEVRRAEIVAEKAIRAVGLRYSSVHVELIRTSDGWKVIEIGPRIGRFRNSMYRETWGIDHGYNDLLVHMGLEPVLNLRSQPSYCAAYSIYPEHEGVLQEITGIDALPDSIGRVVYFSCPGKSKIGSTVRFAKQGGHALCEVIFSSDSLETFQRECAWFEAHVKTVVGA